MIVKQEKDKQEKNKVFILGIKYYIILIKQLFRRYYLKCLFGLALAGGGIKGAAHIGVLQALEEHEIKPEYISGTSSGSIIAALYSLGYSSREMFILMKKYAKIVSSLEKRPIINSIKDYIFKGKLNVDGLSSGEKLEELIGILARRKGIENISDVETNLAISAVDIVSSKEYIMLSDRYDMEAGEEVGYIYNIPLAKAVKASSSFPGVFKPTKYGKYKFVDGGLRDNIPVKVLKDMGAAKTIAIAFKETNYSKEPDMFNVLIRSIDIMGSKHAIEQLKEADVGIILDVDNSSLLEIDDLKGAIKVGYDETMKQMDEILRLISC